MKTIVLGAGVVGTATAYFLAKQGHEVEVIERQSGAALETSFGNGGVIHASEVEPWSQPGMPSKILKWLGKEDAPLLVRYGAIPHMWRWGLKFIANCTPERFRAQFARQSPDRAPQPEDPAADPGRDRRSNTTCARSACSRSIPAQQSFEAGVKSAGVSPDARTDLRSLRTPRNAVRQEPALAASASSLVGGIYFPRDEVGDCHKFTTGAGATLRRRSASRFRYGTTIQRLERSGDRHRRGRDQRRRGCGRTISSRRSASFTPGVLRSVGIDVPIYPVKGVTITVPARGLAGPSADADHRRRAAVRLGAARRSACASPARPRSPATTPRRARRAARRSSRMWSACSRTSPDASIRRRRSTGPACGR